MKRNVVSQILSCTVLVALLCLPVMSFAQGSKVDFSGKWALNATKSNMGQQPQGQGQPPQGGMRMGGGPGGGDFTAKQDANLLTVERTRQGSDGQSTLQTTKYTLDGKECVNSTARGESKSVATWSADGKSLTIVTKRSFERDGQTTEMKTTEVWSMSSPTVLSVVSTMNTPNGERKNTLIYDKK